MEFMTKDDKLQEDNRPLREKLAALGFRPDQDKTDDGLPGIGIIGGVRKPVLPSKPEKP
jgi:hypothetical protein